ncbi:MAG: hypothetical protein CL946_01165, partial [Ectothiorhodospiraceae bacterium]|nr:hypothetical protein [Ectothiorhodospiraceae bacterium]
MKSQTHTIILPFGHPDSALDAAVARLIGKDREYRILKQSIDARQHRSIKVQYSITTDIRDEAEEIEAQIAAKRQELDSENIRAGSVMVVGTGPAGIFAAYWLHRHGIPVTV